MFNNVIIVARAYKTDLGLPNLESSFRMVSIGVIGKKPVYRDLSNICLMPSINVTFAF